MPGMTEQRHGAVAVIKPGGPLVGEDAGALAQSAAGRVRSLLGRLVVDLSASPYIDSLGLEALLDVADEMSRCGQILRLVGVSGTIREVLELTELTNRFEYYDDTNLAVRSFL